MIKKLIFIKYEQSFFTTTSFACNIQIIKNTIYYTYVVEELFLLFLGRICQI
jgi:hypothetical protein